MSIFDKLGLPENAGAEEIATRFLWGDLTPDDPVVHIRWTHWGWKLTDLLAAFGAREREAGRRETWEKMSSDCAHLDWFDQLIYCNCDGLPISDAPACLFATCPLLKGGSDER